ncbi:hypothetical protein niasHT_013054 [Heterodera trifolii]|uniref:Alpha-1,3-mannosyl-glycoprotein 2-beta-N-acetylglucosaminyltransferase n=1 Tax=Heterodera trifolii TaxID=157864 RepID=A0ABD2LE91_9BILA
MRRLKRLYVFMFILSLLSLSLVSFMIVTNIKQSSNHVEYDDDHQPNIVKMDGISDKKEVPKMEQQQPLVLEKIESHVAVSADQLQIPVLVIAAKRAKAISNHLRQLTRLRPSPSQFPIIVSQDGDNSDVTDAITKFVQEQQNVQLIHHKYVSASKKTNAYIRISQHYKFALNKVFHEMGFKLAIITEDDLDIADDFFSYFSALQHLLFEDPTIWCVSAWNDNGNPAIIDWAGGQHKLWRTDFFPGLGWMLKAETWDELVNKWPDAYWDDWLRSPDVRKNRVCIRPEQSRTLHNLQVAGKGSSGALYKGFLSSIRLPQNRVNFDQMNLNFLHKNGFDRWLSAQLNASIEVPLRILLQNFTANLTDLLGAPAEPKKSLMVIYKDPRELRQLSKMFGLMADIRSGMARTAYYGVVPFYQHGVQLFAVHTALNWTTDFDARNSSEIYLTEWDLKSKFLDFAETYCVPKKWSGICDPYDPKMRAWFVAKGWTKRLESWLPVTVF